MALPAPKLISGEEYERLAMDDPHGQLELHDGRLVEKPWMSVEHGGVSFRLARALMLQLDPLAYELRIGHGRLRRSSRSYYVPDVIVVPISQVRALTAHPGSFDLYVEPLPFVVEIWSPSTGAYDIDRKLPDYQARGDREIWRVHPYERRVTAWRRQPDGTYAELVFLGGDVEIPSLPGVRIDLDALFGP
jgi:Uma2 family endonuclease